MIDPIDRNAIKGIKWLTPEFVSVGRGCGKFVGSVMQAYHQGWNDAIDEIYGKIPTVTGEWVRDNYVGLYARCSRCAQCSEVDYYCGHCGAKMKNYPQCLEKTEGETQNE